jgi:hypothetical protein
MLIVVVPSFDVIVPPLGAPAGDDPPWHPITVIDNAATAIAGSRRA